MSMIWSNADATLKKAVMDSVNVLISCFLVMNCVRAKGSVSKMIKVNEHKQ